MDFVLDTSITPARVALAGEMTIYAAAKLKAPLLDAVRRCDALDADLAAVGEIDSAGLQLLILAKREAAAAAKRFAFVGASEPVRSLIALYGLAMFFVDAAPVGPVTAGGAA